MQLACGRLSGCTPPETRRCLIDSGVPANKAMNYKLKFSTQLLLCICGVLFSSSAVAQHALPAELTMPAAAQASWPIEVGETQAFALVDGGVPGGEPQSVRQPQGSISGTVVDQAGAVAVGANVRLALKDQA